MSTNNNKAKVMILANDGQLPTNEFMGFSKD